ncbi:MAG: phosphoribosylaminoimidazolesuccinocarboxamide synthase [Dehalococcoidia bacterium]|nr:phosphoribosylaminoimidazolesuccinocarboxamide synthase [Dehalococcoidia bacterium]
MEAVTETSLPLPLFQRGKVRDVYDLGNELLVVSTDRISALDFVLPSGIPEKGRVLNQMSAFWFKKTSGVLPNHLIESIEDLEALKRLGTRMGLAEPLPDYLIGRSMIVKKAQRISVECVVRGYLSGSAWAEYKKKGTVNGKPMPSGLRESEQMAEPLFTPTTKSESEHDRPLTEADIEELHLQDTMHVLESASQAVYQYAAEYARERGIIIADTKFEFGWIDGQLIFIDEALTPDSSRFWLAKDYAVGRPQDSYDKQPVRDWLASSGWNGSGPVPPVPPDVIEATTQRYTTVFRWIAGEQ